MKVYFRIKKQQAANMYVSLDHIMGMDTGNFVIPTIGQTIRFMPISGNPAQEYQGRIFLVKSIHVDYIPDDNGNISEEYYIGLKKIKSSLSSVTKQSL